MKATEHHTATAIDASINANVVEDTTMDFIPPIYAENKRRSAEIKLNRKAGKEDQPDINLLTSCILSAFVQQDKLTYKELVAFCQKDYSSTIALFHEKEIKEELLKYTNYIPKGMYKHYYEIKPAFKDYSNNNNSNNNRMDNVNNV